METIDTLKSRNSELMAEIERLTELSLQIADINQAFQESQNRFRTENIKYASHKPYKDPRRRN